MLSRTAEYALRAMVCLAGAGPEKTTAQAIAEATSVPEGYMAKVLNTLARAGLVVSQRGPTGGFALAVEPEELSVLRVIEAVEPGRDGAARIASEGCCGRLEALEDLMVSLESDLASRLSSIRIADLLPAAN